MQMELSIEEIKKKKESKAKEGQNQTMGISMKELLLMESEMDLVNQLNMKSKWSTKESGNLINAKDLADKYGQTKAPFKANGRMEECKKVSMYGLMEATIKVNFMKM